jgi:outer membrane protein assembly factor BamB
VVFAYCSASGTSATSPITTVVTALAAGQTQGAQAWQTALPAAAPSISIGPTSGTNRGFSERFSLSSPAQGPDGTIYIGHADGLYALDGATGAVKFHIPGATVASSPAVGADGTIYYGAMDGRLTAASPQGNVLWQVQTGGQVNSSPAIGADGAVFVASDDGYLYAVE